MHRVDTRGMSCPQPVIMTKKALDSGLVEVEVITDNATAKGNIERYAKNNGYNVSEKKEEEEILLIITK